MNGANKPEDQQPLVGVLCDHNSPVLAGDIMRAGYRVKRLLTTQVDWDALPEVDAWVIDCEDSGAVAEAAGGLEPRVLALSNRPSPAELEEYRHWCERIIVTLDRWTADLHQGDSEDKLSDPAAWSEVRAVWLLVGSTGAPGAVKAFLSRLGDTPPIAFVYAQHIDARQESALLSIGSANPALACQLALGRHWLNPAQLLIAPASSQLGFNRQGEVFSTRKPWETAETPSIDGICLAISGIRPAGAIVFSGAGRDGSNGLPTLAALGTRIWAQAPEGCEAPSMPQCAIDSGYTSFVGSPEELAEKLAALYETGC